jgi:predicted acylesterase/phospholipase RssA
MSGIVISAWGCGKNRPGSPDGDLGHSADFPSTQIGKLHYCDGAIRQMTPLSPALHLGADKLFIVGLTSQRPHAMERRASVCTITSPDLWSSAQ